MREIEICDVPDLEVDVATIKQQRCNHENDSASIKLGTAGNSNESKWNFEISRPIILILKLITIEDKYLYFQIELSSAIFKKIQVFVENNFKMSNENLSSRLKCTVIG